MFLRQNDEHWYHEESDGESHRDEFNQTPEWIQFGTNPV